MIACNAAESSADSPKPSSGSSRYNPTGDRQPGVTIGQVSTPTKVRSRSEFVPPTVQGVELEMPEAHGAPGYPSWLASFSSTLRNHGGLKVPERVPE